jgi:hypothetical protein
MTKYRFDMFTVCACVQIIMREQHETHVVYIVGFLSNFHLQFLAFIYQTDIFYLFEMKIKGYLTIIRLRLGDYRGMFAEMKSR